MEQNKIIKENDFLKCFIRKNVALLGVRLFYAHYYACVTNVE